MNIAWLYLDKRNAVINALRDYESMNYIIENIQSKVIATQEDMISLSSPILSDMPKCPHNPHAGENRIAKAMDTVSMLEARYDRALEYVAWFHPAWQGLSEDEQYVLCQFYMKEGTAQADTISEICEHFHIERSSAYKKKDRALTHLTLLLYGK